jgi:hypothetical protein
MRLSTFCGLRHDQEQCKPTGQRSQVCQGGSEKTQSVAEPKLFVSAPAPALTLKKVSTPASTSALWVPVFTAFK